MTKTREMFKTESPEVMAKVEEWWKEMAAEIEQKTEQKAKDKQYYIDQLVLTLAQFLTGMQGVTGWSFSILMGRPSPENGGKVEACSLHVSVTDLGSTFDQAYTGFNNGIMRPYKEFLDHVPELSAGGPRSAASLKSGGESGPAMVTNPSLDTTVLSSGGPHKPTDVSPKLRLEPGPPVTDTTILDTVTPDMELHRSAGMSADLVAVPQSAGWAPPLELPSSQWSASPVLPPLTLDPPEIPATPDEFTFNFGPPTTIDILDNFLAKYAPKPLPQPLPVSNVSSASTSAGNGNKVAMFEEIVAAASAQVRCFGGTPVVETIGVASTSQAPVVDTVAAPPNALTATPIPSTQSDVVNTAISLSNTSVTALVLLIQSNPPSKLPRPIVISLQQDVASTPHNPMANTAASPTNISATTSARLTQSDPPSKLPQSLAATLQQNVSSTADPTLAPSMKHNGKRA
ncbi:hypothetical protein J3R83DRAFT_10341 [Lanmaoa asiatica]|nr:hypothetical protein J3R83DRAFT_10341 [Lanmaoa asiatica]